MHTSRKRFIWAALLLLAVVVATALWAIIQGTRTKPPSAYTTQVDAAPGHGFQWPYYLYVPENTGSRGDEGHLIHILVLPNNTGQWNDSFSVHEQAAFNKATGSWCTRLAEDLDAALLVPVFPRPADNWQLYTHALDRDTLETEILELERLDLQLGAMIDDAIGRLSANGWRVNPKVLMTGFSASGMFANRFTVLHPERVLAAAIGSPGGWPIAPVDTWKGESLRYPIGVGDVEELAGTPFALENFRQVPLFFFIGDQDDNDSVPHDDGYDDKDAILIFYLFGRTPLERWSIAQELYESIGANVDFRVYSGVGHTIPPEMLEDVKVFFEEALQE